jgi:hypothetical protein
MKTTKDRRAFKRISYICEVECEGPGMTRFATRINDLSAAGAFIDSITSVAPGSLLKLRFRIKDLLIDTEAEVRYTMPQVGMGVRFLSLRPEFAQAIQSLVDGVPVEPVYPFNGRPGAADSPARGENILLGCFSVINIFDVIQIIENSRVTGSLFLSLPDESGSIDFNQGKMVDAHAGELRGTEALRKLLDASDGSFEFNKTQGGFEQTIVANSNMSLILDLLRIRDEEVA